MILSPITIIIIGSMNSYAIKETTNPTIQPRMEKFNNQLIPSQMTAESKLLKNCINTPRLFKLYKHEL